MVTEVTMHEAKTHLSRLVCEVEAGGEVIIKRGRHPVARLVPVEPLPKKERQLGGDEGLFEVPEDFNDELPEELLAAFEADDLQL